MNQLKQDWRRYLNKAFKNRNNYECGNPQSGNVLRQLDITEVKGWIYLIRMYG